MRNLNFFEQTTDIFSTLTVFLFGCFLIFMFASAFKATKARALGLYIWHSIFSLVYAFISLSKGADTTTYYILSKGNLANFDLGTQAIIHFTAFFSNNLALSYLGVFMVFNILGSVGLLAVDASLRHVTENKSSFVKFLALIAVLLPSMNFWTGAIGKDSIAYMSTGLLLWASIDFKRNYSLIFIAFIFMFLVRPHIAGIMAFAFTFSLLVTKVSPFKRFVFLIISLIGITVITPIVFQYAGADQVTSVESLQDFIDKRQGYNQMGGGSIDISSMSIFLKMFTFSFRPLPYEAFSLLSFISSIDNLILLVFFILSILSVLFSKRKKFSLSLSHPTENRWFLLIFSLGVMITSSLITSNLGISVRQKWMYMPILIYFIFLIMKVRWSSKAN
tara:strand:- start:2349 stop:3518 length:1170 start_codon:yes stop_codon:yes gene_type:complete